MKGLIIAGFLLSYFFTHAQTKEDSVLYKATIVVPSDTVVYYKEKAIEISKINANKTFRIDKFRVVWVQSENKKGKSKIKKAHLISINDDKMTFKPFNKNFSVITYSDTDILYIGFTSTGRVIIASVSNIVIISAVVIIYLGVAILALLTGPSHFGSSNPDFSWVPFVPFKKNINFYDSRNGDRKWGIRIVEVNANSL